jgi:hypothetical protein
MRRNNKTQKWGTEHEPERLKHHNPGHLLGK